MGQTLFHYELPLSATLCQRWRKAWLDPLSFRGKTTNHNRLGWCLAQDAVMVPVPTSGGNLFRWNICTWGCEPWQVGAVSRSDGDLDLVTRQINSLGCYHFKTTYKKCCVWPALNIRWHEPFTAAPPRLSAAGHCQSTCHRNWISFYLFPLRIWMSIILFCALIAIHSIRTHMGVITTNGWQWFCLAVT